MALDFIDDCHYLNVKLEFYLNLKQLKSYLKNILI